MMKEKKQEKKHCIILHSVSYSSLDGKLDRCCIVSWLHTCRVVNFLLPYERCTIDFGFSGLLFCGFANDFY